MEVLALFYMEGRNLGARGASRRVALFLVAEIAKGQHRARAAVVTSLSLPYMECSYLNAFTK